VKTTHSPVALAVILSLVLAGAVAHAAPISYWAFDDGPGWSLAANSIGGAPAGTLWNMDAATDWVPSMPGFGTALDFDGANDFVDVFQGISETQNTVSMWVRTASGGGIFSVNTPIQGGSNDRNLWVSGGDVSSRVWDVETIGTTGLDLADGAWHHVARQYGPSGHKVYVDGVLVAKGNKTDSQFNWETNLEIGWSNYGDYFTGQIDDVAVWNEELSPNQVRALANGSAPTAVGTARWSGATNNWTSAPDWDTGSVPGPADDTFVDNGGTVQVTTPATPAGLTVGGAGAGTVELNPGGNLDTPNITVAAGGTLALNGGALSNAALHVDGGTVTNSVSFSTPQAVTLDAGGGTVVVGPALTLTGPMDGPGGLTKDGAGTLILTGPNTYGGATNIVNGTLRIEAGAPAGGMPYIPDLAFHVDASDPASVPQVAGPVGVWTNLAGGNNLLQGAAANQPTFVPGVIAGNGAVRFDGNDVISNTLSVGNPYTIFSVSALEGSQNLRLITSRGNNWLLGYWGGGTDRMYAEGWVNNTGAADTALHFYTAAGDGTTTVFRDGSALIASNAGGVTPPVGISLGAYNGNPASEPSRGDVAEILLFDRVLSASEQQAVVDYLQGKWASAIPDNSAVTVQPGATLDLGIDETIGSLAGGGTVNLNPGTLTTGRNNGNTIFSGDIIGAGGLTKVGNGPFYLRGNNTYTGLTTVAGGYLVAQSNTALGTTADGTLVQDGATLQLENGRTITDEALTLNGMGVGGTRGALASWYGNDTWNGPITLATDSGIHVRQGYMWLPGEIDGPGGLAKTGGGVLYVDGDNSYDGLTTVGAGYFVARTNTALGTNAGGTLVQNGATLQFEYGITIAGEALTLNGHGVNGNRGALANWTGNNTWTGDVTLATDSRIYVNTGSLAISGAIDGTGGFIKTGDSPLTLLGSAGNTYAGTTIIADGVTFLDKSGGAHAIGGNVQMGNGQNLAPHLRMTQSDQFAPGSVMSFVNNWGHWARFDLQGTTQTLAGLDTGGVARGAVVQNERSGGGGTSAAGTLILDGAANYAFQGYLRDEDDGGHTYRLNLTKRGPGTQTLIGTAVSYTGQTNVEGGTLEIRNTNQLYTSIDIDPGATAILRQDTGQMNLGNITISGNGTLDVQAGAGQVGVVCGQNGNTYVSMGPGGQINVLSGILRNNNRRGFWTNNQADMYVAPNAILDHYANSITVDALTGGGTVRNNYGGDADVTLTVGVANGSGVFTGVIDEIYHHTPTDNNTGVISLVKEGTGTQTLTGIHTYTGPTNINNGTLHIPAPGSIAGSPLVTVGPSGRLRGDSTVGELDIFGTVAPGNDVGTLTAGNTSFMNGSVYDWEMGADGVVNDILMILGDLNVDAISTLNLLDGGLSQLCTTGARPWQEFDVLHYAGTSSVPMGEVLGVQASMIDLDLFFGFDASQATVLHDPLGKRLYLTGLHAEPIPEPATLALLGLGALALRRRRRRR